MSNCWKIHNKGNCARLHYKISTSKNYLLFILDACEFILSNIHNYKETSLKHGSVSLEDIVICNDRLFCFVSNDKFFSLNFPLNVNEERKTVYYRDIQLSLSSISHIRGALDDLFQCFLKGKRTLEDANNNSSSVLELNELRFVEQILSCESGYVRYDYDKTNENGRFHPLNHLDFNYDKGTFKIGLYRRLTPYEFITIFGCIPQNECSFLERYAHSFYIRIVEKMRLLCKRLSFWN